MTFLQMVRKRARLEDRKAKLERELNAVKKEMNALDEVAFEHMGAEQLRSVKTRAGKIQTNRRVVPVILDFETALRFALNRRRRGSGTELIQKRISSTAWRERLEDGILVPGTDEFEKVTLTWPGTKSSSGD